MLTATTARPPTQPADTAGPSRAAGGLPVQRGPRWAPAPPGADLGTDSFSRHNGAAPFPANGTAHASNAKVLLGRGRLTNEKSEAIFVFGRRV